MPTNAEIDKSCITKKVLKILFLSVDIERVHLPFTLSKFLLADSKLGVSSRLKNSICAPNRFANSQSITDRLAPESRRRFTYCPCRRILNRLVRSFLGSIKSTWFVLI